MDLLKPLATDISINEQIKHIYTYTNLVECNQSFARMYGYKNTKDLMGKSVADFHNVENIPENRNIIRNFINAGYRLVNSESLEKDRNGNMKYFSKVMANYCGRQQCTRR